jgi:CRP/FNR family transcriptional regulator, dissimilatory nitrate respiration regulator
MLESALSLLRLAALTRDAPESVLHDLAASSRFLEVQAGQVLFLEHDPAETIFVLESGYAKPFKCSPVHARELTVGVFGSREALGSLAVLLNSSHYQASCSMLEAGRVLCVSSDAFRDALGRSPEFSRAVLAHVAQRQSVLLERFGTLFFTAIGERLAAYLLEHQHANGFLLPSNSELASLLGTVPELVSRKLGGFYRQGWIRLERRCVWIVQAESLEMLSEPESCC